MGTPPPIPRANHPIPAPLKAPLGSGALVPVWAWGWVGGAWGPPPQRGFAGVQQGQGLRGTASSRSWVLSWGLAGPGCAKLGFSKAGGPGNASATFWDGVPSSLPPSPRTVDFLMDSSLRKLYGTQPPAPS